MNKHPHVVVVGAGIIGASLALCLRRAGAEVTVVDEGRPANRATHGSFGWINAHDPGDETYFRFRLSSIRLWHELKAEFPDLPVRLDGTLNWEDAPDRIEAVQRVLDEGGNTARLLSREEIETQEPNLAAPPDRAIETTLEGAADPARIAEALMFKAMAAGAVLRTNARVEALSFAEGRVAGVEVPEGLIDADAVVLATGVGTADLLADHGFALPMENAPGLLIETEPTRPLTRRVLTCQSLHVWQKDTGTLLVGEDFGGTDPAEGTDAIAARVMGKLRRFFTGDDTPDIADISVYRRPMPADGYPALGQVPGLNGLWVAVTHSGITLAPLIGESLAYEITSGKMVKALHPYRVKRFAGT
jgi:glycine/D-amino acid oxidase-like deaminating enzyme